MLVWQYWPVSERHGAKSPTHAIREEASECVASLAPGTWTQSLSSLHIGRRQGDCYSLPEVCVSNHKLAFCNKRPGPTTLAQTTSSPNLSLSLPNAGGTQPGERKILHPIVLLLFNWNTFLCRWYSWLELH